MHIFVPALPEAGRDLGASVGAMQMTMSASGLYGFSQKGVSAICTALTSLDGNPALATGLVLVAAGVIAQLSFWIAMRRS